MDSKNSRISIKREFTIDTEKKVVEHSHGSGLSPVEVSKVLLKIISTVQLVAFHSLTHISCFPLVARLRDIENLRLLAMFDSTWL